MAQVAGYPPDSLVTLRPFTHRRDGDTMHIGNLDREVVLEIPPDALDILNWLNEGRTVGEAAERYREKHGETPDIDDFLRALEDEGFIENPEPDARRATQDDPAPSTIAVPVEPGE